MELMRKANLKKSKERKEFLEQRLKEIEKEKEAKAANPPPAEKKKSGWW
jgi:hypothetical protein